MLSLSNDKSSTCYFLYCPSLLATIGEVSFTSLVFGLRFCLQVCFFGLKLPHVLENRDMTLR